MAGDIYRFRKERERERENGKERKIRAERESDLLITQTDHKSSRVSTCGATFHAACSRAGTMQKAVAHTEARLTHPPSDVNSLGRYKVGIKSSRYCSRPMATRPTLVFQSPVSRIRVTAPYLRSSITEFFRPLSLNLPASMCRNGNRGREKEKSRFRCSGIIGIDKLRDRWKFRELLAHCSTANFSTKIFHPSDLLANDNINQA